MLVSKLFILIMRFLLVIGFLCVYASGLFAQGAADPNAIDLSGRMDTIARGLPFNGKFQLDPIGFLNIRQQNSDEWEDFEIEWAALENYSTMRYGGSLVSDTANNFVFYGIPKLIGDFDKDGRTDIVDAEMFRLYKGKNEEPYYDSLPSMSFLFHSTAGSEAVIDYDEDGFEDVIGSGVDGSNYYITLYRGNANIGGRPFIFPSDSIALPPHGYDHIIAGKFASHSKPSILLQKGRAITIIPNTTNLSQAPAYLISDTSNNGISTKNMYATDITGDGITDLLLSDGDHIYIFKGGDNFGTYSLTAERAYYVIPSPKLLDPAAWGLLANDFGSNPNGSEMYAVGDLTGSGIPYVAVVTNMVDTSVGYFKPYVFMYAGGKALDSLYDAVITCHSHDGLGGIDTLHSLYTNGRTVFLLCDYADQSYNLNNLGFLVSRDCEKIPHRTNPNLVVAGQGSTQVLALAVSPCFANRYAKLIIESKDAAEATIRVYDVLGKVVEKRNTLLDSGSNTEYINTTNWVSGTYTIQVETNVSLRTKKIVVGH